MHMFRRDFGHILQFPAAHFCSHFHFPGSTSSRMFTTQQQEFAQGWTMACKVPAQQQSLFILFGIKTSKMNVFSFWTPELQTKHNVLYIFFINLFEINSKENWNNQQELLKERPEQCKLNKRCSTLNINLCLHVSAPGEMDFGRADFEEKVLERQNQPSQPFSSWCNTGPKRARGILPPNQTFPLCCWWKAMRSLFTTLVLPNKFCMKTCQPSPGFLLAGWEGDECLMQTTPPAWWQTTAPAQPLWSQHSSPALLGCSAPHNSITSMQIRANYHNWLPTAWLGRRKGKIILCQAPGESDLAKSNIATLLLMFSPNSKNLINSQ